MPKAQIHGYSDQISVKPGERIRFEATVVERTPGMYGFSDPVIVVTPQ